MKHIIILLFSFTFFAANAQLKTPALFAPNGDFFIANAKDIANSLQIVDSITQRNSITKRYNGMYVAVTANKKMYRLDSINGVPNNWTEFSSGSGGGGSYPDSAIVNDELVNSLELGGDGTLSVLTYGGRRKVGGVRLQNMYVLRSKFTTDSTLFANNILERARLAANNTFTGDNTFNGGVFIKSLSNTNLGRLSYAAGAITGTINFPTVLSTGTAENVAYQSWVNSNAILRPKYVFDSTNNHAITYTELISSVNSLNNGRWDFENFAGTDKGNIDIRPYVISPSKFAADSIAIYQAIAAGGGGGAVSSVFGRTGAVTAQNSDYASFYSPVTHTHTIANVVNLQSSLDAKLNLADSILVPNGYTTKKQLNDTDAALKNLISAKADDFALGNYLSFQNIGGNKTLNLNIDPVTTTTDQVITGAKVFNNNKLALVGNALTYLNTVSDYNGGEIRFRNVNTSGGFRTGTDTAATLADVRSASSGGTVDTFSFATRAWRQKGIDSVTASTTAAIRAVDRAKVYQSLGSQSSTVVLDVSVSRKATVTLTGNCALTISNSESGDQGSILVIQDGTGSRTLSIASGGLIANGVTGAGRLLPLSTTANRRDIVQWENIAGTIYYWVGNNFVAN